MTAETAVTFPVVVLALAVVLLAASTGRAAVACVDGARGAARELSRGEDVGSAVARARGVLDRPAAVEVSPTGSAPGLVRVQVTVGAGPSGAAGGAPGGWGVLSWQPPVSCTAHAWLEPAG